MKGRDLIDEINAADPRADVYIDIGGAAGPYLKVIGVHHYETGVRGKPTLILVAHPDATMAEQKKMLVSTLAPALESAKRALSHLIAIETHEDMQLELLRPKKKAKVIELNPLKKK